MLFSVVIPTFNRLQYLPATLASVRAQRFTDFEVIVVDDGSTDGTQEFLSTLGSSIRAVHQPNLGPGAARNAGAAAAAGEYIAFLDSDDIWFPWTLETFAGVNAGRSPAFIAGGFLDFRQESELASLCEGPIEVEHFRDYVDSAALAISVGGSTPVVSRAVFAASGGFITRRMNAEDHDFALRVGVVPGFAYVRAPTMVGWRRHDVSETADLSKSIDGVSYLVGEERAGRYPGGAARAQQRRRIITRHVRPITLACLRERRFDAAFGLYRSTFSWNLAAGHWKFLAAVPILGAWTSLRRAA